MYSGGTTHNWKRAPGSHGGAEMCRWHRIATPSISAPFSSALGAHAPERIRRILDALVTHYGAVRTRLKLAPATLIHADIHLDNILFSSPADEPGLVLIDWQTV